MKPTQGNEYQWFSEGSAMTGIGRDESVGVFLIRYVVGFVAFFGSFILISFLFGNSDDITVSDDGTVHLGLVQTYVESLAGLSPLFFIFLMVFSALIIGAIYWMMRGLKEAIKKAFEAVGVWLAFWVLGMIWFTPSILSELDSQYAEAVGDPWASVELPGYIALNSSLFIGCLFIWINFLLEAARLRPKKAADTLRRF